MMLSFFRFRINSRLLSVETVLNNVRLALTLPLPFIPSVFSTFIIADNIDTEQHNFHTLPSFGRQLTHSGKNLCPGRSTVLRQNWFMI